MLHHKNTPPIGGVFLCFGGVELVTVVNEAPVGPQSCDLSEAAAEGETLLCSKSHILSESAGECVRLSYPPYSFSKNFNSI